MNPESSIQRVRQATWVGSFVKVAAYNVQAYPIVALAPIIFILLGDGFISRVLIAARSTGQDFHW